MTSNESHSSTVELRTISWPAMILLGLGGFVFLVSFILLFIPPKEPLPSPWAPYVPVVLGAVMLAVGGYLFANMPVGLRLEAKRLTLPKFNVSIPWTEIIGAEIARIKPEKPGPPPRLYLVLMCTPKGRARIGDRLVTNINPNDVSAINPKSDVCLKLDFFSYGPGIDTPFEFAVDLNRRIAAASGRMTDTASESPPVPSLDAPLVERDMSETGRFSRVYIHETCGHATAINGSSLTWVANPLRYTGRSTMCVQCGGVPDFTVRWADTGETLSRYRARMWRHTPLFIKLLQFVVIPGFIGAVIVIGLPILFSTIPMLTIPRMLAGFGVGFLGANLLIGFTSIAGAIPSLMGIKYHEYR